MPRRRPSQVRAEQPVRTAGPGPRYRAVSGLSGACEAEIVRLERERFLPGTTWEAFRHWRRLAHGPLRDCARFEGPTCGEPMCGCAPMFFRDQLEAVLCALSKKSARELRARVRALDAKILDRAKVLSARSPDSAWWREQLRSGR